MCACVYSNPGIWVSLSSDRHSILYYPDPTLSSRKQDSDGEIKIILTGHKSREREAYVDNINTLLSSTEDLKGILRGSGN